MKYFLLLSLVCLCAFVVYAKTVDEEFEDFKKKFNKSYPTPEEEAKRKQIFADNYKEIQEHNKKYYKGEVSHTEGINEFADQTHEEFAATHHGFRIQKPKV